MALLGFDLKTEGKATWTNYIAYNDALRGVQHALAERLGAETSLLDAHSFAWMLGRSVYKGPDSALVEGNIRRVADYTALAAKDREAIVRARIGQGVFRDRLIDYWGACAVTGCENPALLRASHVKPWRDCDVHEALDPFNGVLLSASIDAAFDAGLISFDDQGRILVSTALGASDRGAVGIHDGLSLQRIDARHLPFLRYHREVLFKPEG